MWMMFYDRFPHSVNGVLVQWQVVPEIENEQHMNSDELTLKPSFYLSRVVLTLGNKLMQNPE